jgi:hypothetical protein
MRPRIFGIALAIAALGITSTAYAVTVNLGWADIDPCSRVTASGNNLLDPISTALGGGNTPDTVETAEQRMYVDLSFDAPSADSITNAAESCALQAAASAGIAGLASDGTAAVQTFWAGFQGCMGSAGFAAQAANLQLNWHTECEWGGAPAPPAPPPPPPPPPGCVTMPDGSHESVHGGPCIQ